MRLTLINRLRGSCKKRKSGLLLGIIYVFLELIFWAGRLRTLVLRMATMWLVS